MKQNDFFQKNLQNMPTSLRYFRPKWFHLRKVKFKRDILKKKLGKKLSSKIQLEKSVPIPITIPKINSHNNSGIYKKMFFFEFFYQIVLQIRPI